MKKYTIERTSLLYRLLRKVLRDSAMPSNTCELRNMMLWWTLLFPLTIIGYLTAVVFGERFYGRYEIIPFAGYGILTLMIITALLWALITHPIKVLLGILMLFLAMGGILMWSAYKDNRITKPTPRKSTFRKLYQDLKDKVCTPIEYT